MTIRLRDPVHNFIQLYEDEIRLLDTKAIQRLRGISQLAMAYLVYPGAVHTRFDHSIGVMHLSGLMAQELKLEQDEIELVRLAALLHDVGHGPFSHVSEHSLDTFADRLKLSAEQKKEKIHELISAKIIESDKEIVNILGERKCKNISKLLGVGYGQPVLKSIVSGPLDSDKQDYLLRDSLFCGVKYGVFDIHQFHRSLTLGGDEGEKELWIKSDGVHAVEQYILAKYYLITNVYRHKVRLITDQMIIRAIELGIEKDKIDELVRLYTFDCSGDFVSHYKEFDDALFMQKFCINGKDGSKSKELLLRLKERRLFKRVFDCSVTDFQPEVSDILPKLINENKKLADKIEADIARETQDLANQEIDSDFVIINVFNISSVREISRNDESGILVAGVAEEEPKPFEEKSTLFASINERYTDEFVEVYAPVKWDSVAEKKTIRRKLKEPILRIIEENILQVLKELENEHV